MRKSRKTLASLLFYALLFFSFFLRLYRLPDNPPSLNWDEVSHGFNAYSILRTGKDEWGVKLPLIFRCFGDYKLPLYIYLTVVPVKFLGLTPLAVRLISVLSGVGLVAIAYLLGREVSKSKEVGLWAAFLTAVSPWGLFVSRVAVEANLAAFLLASGVYCWLKGRFLWGGVLLGLTLHSYNSARILTPLIFIFLLLYDFRKLKWKKMILLVVVWLIFLLPVIFQLRDRSGGARYFWVSPVDQGAINQIIEKRNSSSLSPTLARLIYNRPVYFLSYSFKKYWSHFSLSFLFLKGGDHYQFSLPEHGVLYLITAPFLILGLGWFFKKRSWLPLFWFGTAFIPSAITRDSPHVLRSLLVLPLPMVFAAVGLWLIRRWLKSRSYLEGGLVAVVFVVGVLVNLFFWWRDYWQIYRPAYSWAWQYGYREAVDYVKEYYSQYEKIIFTKKYGEPHEFVLFYWPWEPSYYQQDPKKVWNYHAHWYWIDAFDKFEFWNDWEVKEKLKLELKSKLEGIESESKNKKEKKLLLITSPGNWIEGGKLLKTINFLDGGKAFEIVEY